MARSFVLGNGNILVCLDENSQIADFYYPQVGQYNHVEGYRHKFGIWADGEFFWFESEQFKKKLSYIKDSLVTNVLAENEKVGVELQINDTVCSQKNIFLRKIEVINKLNKKRDFGLYLHQIFSIAGSHVGNTVYYDPKLKAVVFYKGKNYFLVNGIICNEEKHGISSFATGIFEHNGYQGTWVDAQDGKLSNNPIEHGSVDSTVSFNFELEPLESKYIYYWICVGDRNTQITQLNDFVLENTPQKIIDDTIKSWQSWVNRTKFKFEGLSDQLVNLFKRSLLIIRSHADNDGAFIASGDSGVLHLKKDTYAYMWPRDGALISRSLDRAGYQALTQKFFQFCCSALTSEGYLFHKYNADGSLGSSWHAWLYEGKFQLPIQQDQLALVLDAMWKHYAQYKQQDYSKKLFECFVKPAGNFMYHFMDEELGLPKQSYDLWEEKLGIYTFTCSTVFAGFRAVANFAEAFGTKDEAKVYIDIAEKVRKNIIKHFYDPERKYFIKGFYYKNGKLKKDLIVDSSSFYGIFEYRVLDIKDEKVENSYKAFKDKLLSPGNVGGFARYENDRYYRVSQNGPGNPWFITTLWLAEYYIQLATNLEELKPALGIFEWVNKYKMDTGILAEQLDPNTGNPLSVAPLTWSHAAYVIAVNKYLEKLDKLGVCKMCNPPKIEV